MSGTRHISTILLGLVLIALQAFGSAAGGQASSSWNVKALDAIDSDWQVEPCGEETCDWTVATATPRLEPLAAVHMTGLPAEHLSPIALVHAASGAPRAPPTRRH
jgi:hypothetical protein